MELRPGYKQTEVGVIPKDWKSAKLGEHAAFRTGPFGTALHKSDYTGDGVPVVNPMHIFDAQLVPTRTMTVTEAAARLLPEFRLRPADVIIGRRGDMGRCAVVREQHAGWLCGTGSMIIRCRDGLSPEFLQRVLSSPRAIAAIEDSSVGSTMTNLNQGVLASLRIQYPGADEQRAIAAALGDVDALLGSLTQLIAKKRDLKQAAMQQLLTGQTRLPGFHGEWNLKQLGDFGKCVRGVTYKGDFDLSPYDTERTVRLLRANNVQNASVVTSDIQYVNEDRVSDRQFLARDDILICMANGSKDLMGKAAHFDVVDGQRYTFGAFMACYRVDTKMARPVFVSLLFQTGRYRNYITNLITGSSINNLQPSSIEALEFRVPADAEQTAIAAVLSDIDAELAVMEQRLAKTRALQQGMMQELLTGWTRLV